MKTLLDVYNFVGLKEIRCERLTEKQALNLIESGVFNRKKSKYSDFLKVGPAVFQIANVLSKNNRLYPKEVLQEAVKEALPVVKGKKMIGELDHMTASESPFPKLAFCSHLITNLWMDDDKVYGEAVVLKTPYGDILRDILESGVKVGISARGYGDTEELHEGSNIYQKVKKFKLLSYEFVSWPGFNLYVDKNQTKKIESIFESQQFLNFKNNLSKDEEILYEVLRAYRNLTPIEKLILISKLFKD